MRSKTKTIVSAAAAAIALAAGSATAKPITSPAPDAGPDTFGSCGYGGNFYTGSFRIGFHRGSSYHGGSHYHGGYHGGYHRPVSYHTRCRVIDRYYFSSGCHRYCRITYLHEKVDHCGRVVSCWRTCKTIRV